MNDDWILALPDDVFADCLGGGHCWSAMTVAERDAYGPDETLPKKPPVIFYKRWLRELRLGLRGATDNDELRQAAGWEHAGAAAWRLGMYDAALRDFQMARRIGGQE